MTAINLIPVILSGGTGARLWPVSRESHPKPFIKLPDGESLLQKVYQRAAGLPGVSEIMTITNREYYLKSQAEYGLMTQLMPAHRFLLEPFSRNTAPAILLAALSIAATHDAEAIMLVLPADHLIDDVDAFRSVSEKAVSLAKLGKVVLLGITPTFPETGFGYIQCGDKQDEKCFEVKQFVEKPTLSLAETYAASGEYLWNSGMFCFKAETILQAFAQHAPALYEAAKKCWLQSQKKSYLDPDSFAELENISIDYAVIEKCQNMTVVACDLNWQDIGSWEAYKKLHPADSQGNTVLGEAVLVDANNNFIYSENRMVATIGIDNLAIIDTPDALLITHRDRSQDVKQVVETLKKQSHKSYLSHQTVVRPWGTYTILEEGPAFKIKRIVVSPSHSISLQLHHHRSEHWVVVEGIANVIKDKEEYILYSNESIFVPKETLHRLSNPGKTNLVIIEVQIGDYLGEDDIVRFADTYGRVEAARGENENSDCM